MARPGPPLARLAWRVLRYGRTEQLAYRLPDWTVLFAQVHAAPDGTANLTAIIHYLFWVWDKTTRQVTGQVLHSVMDAQQAEALMRSYGETLIERGHRRGLKQGLAQGVLRILAARGLLVDEQARQRILTCTDMATLDTWFDRALTATTLSEVWGEPTQQ
ncbi:hypothetical protein ACN28I_05860 [Archangium gephyra]|uniref:hypothetical protein n=1 Tax=Archangium gephyra TaxID=48 RepID=UPI003B8122C6